MGPSSRAVCLWVVLVGGTAGATLWTIEKDTRALWIARGVFAVITAAGIAALVYDHFVEDVEPDYIGHWKVPSYHKDGLELAFQVSKVGDVAQLHIFFQNQFERPCEALVSLRPVVPSKAGIATSQTRVLIKCPGGALGLASQPLRIPRELQGRSQFYEIGANVDYHGSQGRRLRFGVSPLIHRDADFDDTLQRTLFRGMMLAGHVIVQSRTETVLELPDDVVEVPDGDRRTQIQILWTPGDPPLQLEASDLPGETDEFEL